MSKVLVKLPLMFSIALAAIILTAPLHATALEPTSEQLPDLTMAPLRDFRLETTAAHRRLLRFTAEIVNQGSGPFELVAQRASVTEQMMTQVQQRILNQAGEWRSIPVTTTLYFAGDGHLHWHVRDLELYTLESLAGATTLGTSAKGGFCFSDSHPKQAGIATMPALPFYTSCGEADNLRVRMGLSVGWGDIYDADLPDQYIDITDLAPGYYRLHATADPNHIFVEQQTNNNVTSTILHIQQAVVQELGYSVFVSLVQSP